jgi:hypothetical protein
MQVTFIDVLIAIPVLPLLPVLATWFLPWEDWLPKKIPTAVLGPYFLYAAFAAWHFKFGFWFVLAGVVLGIVVSILAIVEKYSH